MSTKSEFTQSPDPEYLAILQFRMNELRATTQRVLNETNNPFTWEIGSGHGHFLIRYASENPSRFFVGIDLLSDRLRKAEKKQGAAGLKNICFLKAEAEEFLACLGPEVAIEEVLILFPDPWPKKRHHKNRLIQTRFLDSLAARMLRRGRMYFRTDFEPYFLWTRELIASHPRWEIDDTAPWVFEEATVFQRKSDAFHSLVARIKTPSPEERTPG